MAPPSKIRVDGNHYVPPVLTLSDHIPARRAKN